MHRVALVLVLVLCALNGGCRSSDTSVVVRSVDDVTVIEVSRILDAPGSRQIVSALSHAEKDARSAVLISCDFPGGELQAIVDVTEAISRSSIPTIVYVKEQFGSGVLVLAAADVIYFAPRAVCGSADVVADTGDEPANELVMKVRKYVVDVATKAAEASGHDPKVFVAMIDPSYELLVDGEIVKPRGRLLSLTAREAKRIGLSRGTAADVETVIRMYMAEKKG